MILITGASGFVGRHVVAALAAAGRPAIRCLVHRASQLRPMGQFPVELAQGNVRDPASLSDALRGVETVVHLVAVIRERGRNTTFEWVNLQGTRSVIQAARAAGVQHLVHISTVGVREDPRLRYLHSRWMAEQEVLASGLPSTILRFSVGYGPGDEFVNTLAGLVKALPIIPVAGNGRNRFQPIAVEEVARCIAMVVQDPKYRHQIIEIGGPEHLTYNQILDVIAETYGVRRLKLHIPLPLMRLLVVAMELALPRPPVTLEQLKLLPFDNITALDSVERVFGFRPRPMKGNIEYIKQISRRDAVKIALGFIPRRIRDH